MVFFLNYLQNKEIGNIYDASQVKPNRLLIWLVLVLPKLYSGYSVRLICLTLLRLVPSFIYVTNFPYEKMINFLFVITETTFNPHHNRSIHPHQRTLLRSPWNRFQTCLFSPKKSEDSFLAHFFNSFQELFLCMSPPVIFSYKV